MILLFSGVKNRDSSLVVVPRRAEKEEFHFTITRSERGSRIERYRRRDNERSRGKLGKVEESGEEFGSG